MLLVEMKSLSISPLNMKGDTKKPFHTEACLIAHMALMSVIISVMRGRSVFSQCTYSMIIWLNNKHTTMSMQSMSI